MTRIVQFWSFDPIRHQPLLASLPDPVCSAVTRSAIRPDGPVCVAARCAMSSDGPMVRLPGDPVLRPGRLRPGAGTDRHDVLDRDFSSVSPSRFPAGRLFQDADGVAEDHNPGAGPFRGRRSLPERVSCRGGQQQQRRAEPSERSHGLAWKTARSSPSERISSIGPSMS